MGFALIILVLGLADLLVARAGALAIALLIGWFASESGISFWVALASGLIVYVAADHLMVLATDREDWIAKCAHVFSALCGASVLGFAAFLVGQDQSVPAVFALSMAVFGAIGGALVALRRYGAFA